MKLLSIAIPCYNSEAYMEKCIKSLLTRGRGSGNPGRSMTVLSDRTAEIADAVCRKSIRLSYRAIHQPNLAAMVVL